MRPFKQPWLTGRRSRLDLKATIDDYSRSLELIPTFRPAPERWFELVIVVDRSFSMAVWQETVAELIQILRGTGAFRKLHVWDMDPTQERLMLRGPRGQVIVPRQMNSSDGRRLALVVSDCSSEGWRSGLAWTIIREWARAVPIALVNPLPPKLWRRTGLDMPSVRVDPPGVSGARNSALRYEAPFMLQTTVDACEVLTPLPALAMTPYSLGRWARTLMRIDRRGCDAIVVPDQGLLDELEILGGDLDQGLARLGVEDTLPPGDAIVDGFLHVASPEAVRLAVLCAPYQQVGLPLLHLIREELVPEATASDEAEVILSGLFVISSDQGGRATLRFREGIRAELKNLLSAHDAWLLHDALSRRVDRLAAARGGFLAVAQDPHGNLVLPADAEPFAEASVDTLRLLGVMTSSFASVSQQALGRLVGNTESPTSSTGQALSEPPSAAMARHITSGPPVRSAYLEQVRRIAPAQLHDRDGELAELAAFCAEPGRSSYAWWRAPAWAGKSALMSWFVLHPPPGVQVVSFFVTARYKGQGDRGAFTDAVLEQLADLLGQPIPAYLTETTREPHLLRLLTQAAEECQRLVLVIDGLDQDRGVMAGPDAHSIAALLPARPPAGLRVIVAGRPDPPIPADIPGDHPLRDPAIVRMLSTSPSAEVVKTDMQRELRRLLHGDQAEQDLLGLVAAAGGGLSARDLAELTSMSVYEIEDNLHAIAGRTFISRASIWQPGTAPPVYVLGHEELQMAATAFLGGARLGEYRERLHAWAEDYRQRGWPAGTPEYLLRGYFRMLHDAVDIRKLVACATDKARHDRMLDITGGDTAAFAEITDVRDLLLRLDEPDPSALASLNAHLRELAERNTNVPTGLPAVLASLGQPTRAEAVARSITDSDQRAWALAGLAEAAAGTGDLDRAEALARSITGPAQRARALAGLTEAASAAGDLDRAEMLARSITDPAQRARALAGAAEAVAGAGDLDRAEALARSITDTDQRARALAGVVEAAVGAGDLDRAEMLARSITDTDQRARALAGAAEAAVGAGDLDRAEALAQAITDLYHRAWALAGVAEAVAGAGDLDRAEALARSITDTDQRARALAGVVEAAAGAGDLDRAEALARSITDPAQRARALAGVAEAVAGAGDLDRAEALARAITDLYHRAWALAGLAEVAVSVGDRARARALVERAEVAVRTADLDRARALAERAGALAQAITDPYQRTWVLTSLVQAIAGLGDLDRARVLAEQAEALARSITDADQRARVLVGLAEAVAGAGDLDRAEALVRSITDPAHQARALAGVAEVAVSAGDLDRAEALVRSITGPAHQARALATLVEAMARAGDIDRAETLANGINDPGQHAGALTTLAKMVSAAGDYRRATTLAESAAVVARTITHAVEQA